ncbi:hypothetical protein GIB67_041766 [Kingdonia uniflora]|uniref:Uncharacterized protein n=1 Tax=Kingdonia uniflora TaxID=39325 RepID=A0A7J7M4R6_9MAGN|nr:hypothetical protein GIB67_041766 [Kingdonia uniflora]
MLDFLRGWICSLLLRHCATLLGASVKETVFKLDVERDEYSNIMASISPIDITSSDSENEVEVRMGNGASFPNGSAALAIPRKLPSWEPTSSINLKDGFQFSVGDRNVNRTTDDNRRNSFDRVGSSSYLERPGGNFGKVPPQSNPWRGFTPNIQPSSSISKTTASSENGSRTDDLKFSVGDKNVSRTADDNRKSSFDRVGSSNYFERPGGDFGNVSSQSNPRRALPTTIQPSVSTSTTRTSMENGGSSQVFNVHGKSHNFVDVNSTDRKDYSKDRFGRGNTDEGFIHDRNGTRLLPQSLIHGKSMSTSQSNGTSDPSYHSGPGDANGK